MSSINGSPGNLRSRAAKAVAAATTTRPRPASPPASGMYLAPSMPLLKPPVFAPGPLKPGMITAARDPTGHRRTLIVGSFAPVFAPGANSGRQPNDPTGMRAKFLAEATAKKGGSRRRRRRQTKRRR